MDHPELIPLAATFAAVVREGGIRGAARALGISKATVSRQLQSLEASLGLRILERSTRSMRVTEEGIALLTTLESVRNAWNDGLSQLAATREDATGRLRVTAPELMVDGLLCPAMRTMTRRHPTVDVDLVASDRVLDLVEEGIDIAVRAGHMPDSSMQRVKLSRTRERLVGVPELFEGTSPADRDALDPRTLPWVGHTGLPVGPERELVHRDGHRLRIAPVFRARCASSAAFLGMVRTGVGVGLLPELFVQELLARGALVALPWFGRAVPIDAVFPAGSLAPPRVRRFLDILREQLGS